MDQTPDWEMNILESIQVFISFFNSTSFFYLHKQEQLTQDSVIIGHKSKSIENFICSVSDIVNLWVRNYHCQITTHLLNDFCRDKIRLF